jgi:hypothetical protein
VPARDEALRMKDLPGYKLLRYSPRLQWDHPTGKPTRLVWIGKP